MNTNHSDKRFFSSRINIIIVTLITAFTGVTALAQSQQTQSSEQSVERFRAKMKLSGVVEPDNSSTQLGYYDKRTGKVGIIHNPDLVFSINQPRKEDQELIFNCGQYLVCCASWQYSGCTDFIFECADIGCQDHSIGGGQHGVCDCSPAPSS